MNKRFDYIQALKMIQRDGLLLQFVEDQSDEICIEAVKQNCHALKYVKNKKIEICLEALNKDYQILKNLQTDFQIDFLLNLYYHTTNPMIKKWIESQKNWISFQKDELSQILS